MNECAVLLDFTTIHESSQFKLKDLDFVIYTKDVDYQLHHEFFDFFCEAPNDYQFVYEALNQLDRIVEFSQFTSGVHFWSDTAFRTRPILYIFDRFEDHWGIPMSINYFAPHHGWNFCDTHFGHAKKLLRQKHRASVIRESKNITDVFELFENATVTLFPSIPRQYVNEKFFQFKNKGISKYSCFEIPNSSEVKASVMTGDVEQFDIEFNE
jgi:hypothetical protein